MNKNIICFHLERVQENSICLIFLTNFIYYGFMEFMFTLPLGPKEIHKHNRMPKHRSIKCLWKTILPIQLKQVFTSFPSIYF